MTSCELPTAHLYDRDDSMLVNLLGEPDGPFACPGGFLIAIDESALVLFAGTILGALVWKRAPRLSGALIVGSVIYWASSQFYTLEMLRILYRDHHGAYLYQKHHFAAAVSQATFEFLAFAVFPMALISLAVVLRRKRAHRSNRAKVAG